MYTYQMKYYINSPVHAFISLACIDRQCSIQCSPVFTIYTKTCQAYSAHCCFKRRTYCIAKLHIFKFFLLLLFHHSLISTLSRSFSIFYSISLFFFLQFPYDLIYMQTTYFLIFIHTYGCVSMSKLLSMCACVYSIYYVRRARTFSKTTVHKYAF